MEANKSLKRGVFAPYAVVGAVVLLLLAESVAIVVLTLKDSKECGSPDTTEIVPRQSTSDKSQCLMGGIIRDKSVKTAPPVPHLYGVGAEFLPANFTPFAEILCQSKCEKKIHFYGHMYSEYLDPLRLQQKVVNLLEIGLKGGDSLNLWLAAFPEGKIYGLDAFYSNPLSGLEDSSVLNTRMKVFQGDQENVTTLKQVIQVIQAEVGLLDFIIDDGGHTMGQQLTSFTHLFPMVRPGGVYFIEDLQTSYWEKKCHRYYNGKPYCYGGGPPGAKNTMIDLIKSLIDVINADFIEDHGNFNMGAGIYTVNPVDKLVGSVQCWRNMCAIRRKFESSFF